MKPLSTAIWLAKRMLLLGLICGVLYSVGGFFVDLFTIGLNWGTLMAFGALVGMPAIFGAFGFICGFLMASVARGVMGMFSHSAPDGD